ncbi:MAG: dihydrofolate reductase [Methylacidiphilales bacterium]|nr:dihydrofolate reductase [Candidatus Methylacidiphilales bacterium]
MPTFHAIVAMSENRVIGDKGKIPWHIPDEYRWFKHKTMGGTLVMGRKTFESIGEALPGRKTLVLTHRSIDVPGVETCSDLALFLNDYLKAHPDETYWISGGSMIYTQLLDQCAYLYLTTVKRRVEGDAFFLSAEHVQKTHTLDQIIYDEPRFRVERWAKRNLPETARLAPEPWPFPEKNR